METKFREVNHYEQNRFPCTLQILWSKAATEPGKANFSTRVLEYNKSIDQQADFLLKRQASHLDESFCTISLMKTFGLTQDVGSKFQSGKYDVKILFLSKAAFVNLGIYWWYHVRLFVWLMSAVGQFFYSAVAVQNCVEYFTNWWTCNCIFREVRSISPAIFIRPWL